MAHPEHYWNTKWNQILDLVVAENFDEQTALVDMDSVEQSGWHQSEGIEK